MSIQHFITVAFVEAFDKRILVGLAGLYVADLDAALFTAECPGRPSSLQDPVSIAGERTGATFDLGFYSRLREVNADDRFAVFR
jgi:hypothetical protein